jgi:hypothetical protein
VQDSIVPVPSLGMRVQWPVGLKWVYARRHLLFCLSSFLSSVLVSSIHVTALPLADVAALLPDKCLGDSGAEKD